MAENKLIIGSLPVMRGEYDNATSYYRDNQVTMYGSTFQSLSDDNVGFPPAELREDGKVYAINTDKWIIVANAIDAYNAGERIANAETRIKELGEYADSPEFIRVYTDANGKFLWGIRVDGSVEWAKGVPTPVQNAIRELKDKLETQDIKSLQDAIDIINASLKPLTDTFSYQDNDEFAQVITDADGKILFGIKTDGSPYYPNNEMYHVIQNDEYLAAWVDANNKILFGIKTDGSTYIAKSEYINAVKEIQAKIESLSETFSHQDNPEFMAVTTDSEGKVLEATQSDGKKYFPKQALLDKYDDVEGRTEMTLDADDRVLAYRDSEGKKHEHSMETKNLEVSNLSLQGNSVNNIQDALKENGFDIKGKTDWSDWYDKHDSALELPIPTKAVINITGVNQMPSKKLVNDKAYIEFFDFAGNYFKIKAYLNAQGASTMADPMKSCAIDLFSDDWGGNEFEIKFGDWVAQDGFHLKALYKDSLKSIQPICYEIGEQITSFLNVRSNRFHISSDNVLIGGTGDMENDVSQAKCMPSQFPCEVYLNGEYYGLFIWSPLIPQHYSLTLFISA